MTKIKLSDDDIFKYLESNWRDHEGYSDFNLALDLNLIEYAAKIIYDAGAIDSKHCYDWAKPYEQAIEKMLKKYTEKQERADRETLLNNCEVYINDSNEHYFINESIHLVNSEDLNSWGFRKKSEIYTEDSNPDYTTMRSSKGFGKV